MILYCLTQIRMGFLVGDVSVGLCRRQLCPCQPRHPSFDSRVRVRDTYRWQGPSLPCGRGAWTEFKYLLLTPVPFFHSPKQQLKNVPLRLHWRPEVTLKTFNLIGCRSLALLPRLQMKFFVFNFGSHPLVLVLPSRTAQSILSSENLLCVESVSP